MDVLSKGVRAANCELLKKIRSDRRRTPAAPPGVSFTNPAPLEIKLYAKLKLAWVEGGGGAAVIPTIAGTLIESFDVVNEG